MRNLSIAISIDCLFTMHASNRLCFLITNSGVQVAHYHLVIRFVKHVRDF